MPAEPNEAAQCDEAESETPAAGAAEPGAAEPGRARSEEDGPVLAEAEADAARRLLRRHPRLLRDDPDLLAALGLRLDAANVVDFGPVALSRVSAAHEREFSERRRLEAMARANFAAQTQTHAAVIDVLRARDAADLAGCVDRLARERFGLLVGALALEGDGAPAGWRPLLEGQVDLALGRGRLARLGRLPIAAGLFGDLAPRVQSAALARLTLRSSRDSSAAQGILALGSADPEAFAEDMGPELVAFLAAVVEHAAERGWRT
jgi:uncharacterized protein YigA (DUF484 family)